MVETPEAATSGMTALGKLTRNRLLRVGLLALVAGLAIWGLASQWTQVQTALRQLDFWQVAAAGADVLAGLFCMMLAWRALLADLGSPLPVPVAIRVMFVGQLGKYVPGAVWAVAAQVELARDYEVPRRRSVAAGLVAMATTLVVGLVMAGITLPLTSKHAMREYWWVLAVTPVAIGCLYPPVARIFLNLVLRVARRQPLERAVSLGATFRALGWTALGWICYGLQAWLLIRQFTHGGTHLSSQLHLVALSFGAYALSWAAGFLLIFFPGGIGPREAALVAVLTPVMPAGSALVVALASRMVMT
ncbi:MAG TPA: lysylphosphatidylglycerol synthase transmembrane domain-containing protein, partial [Streptosporangiaceae bacterium]|nr:lysylphosphatidylglycerol synthase transmembrane domain-containing protein [Streptosporangiaceae bacterium]